jgi:hypothetical protein
MLHEAGYDVIELYSATKGMNKALSPELLPSDYSFYIENIMPTAVGEGQVRFGTSSLKVCDDTIIEAFPFQSASGNKQQVLYFNGYNNFLTFTNLNIVSSETIILTSPNYALFQPDTYLSLRYVDLNGLSSLKYYQILSITNISGLATPLGGVYPANTISIQLENNSFASDLAEYYVLETHATGFTYVSGTSFTMAVPVGFIASNSYFEQQNLTLTVNAAPFQVQINMGGINIGTPGQITFTVSGDTIPVFGGGDTVTLEFESPFPTINSISNSSGYIKIYDLRTNAILAGGNQTLGNLSVACVPRCEFFAGVLWICNGVDPIMTWDGSVLQIYKEYVKANATAFSRTDNTHFTFVKDSLFNITKYQNNNTINLVINGVTSNYTVSNVSVVGDVVTITTTTNLSAFVGTDNIELFYADMPPRFSYMRVYNDRLWCLGEGAVSLSYRAPNQALTVYYSYTTWNLLLPFRFFDEVSKAVPLIDISSKHGVGDNLEAIVSVNGLLAFIGREKTQVWQGTNPLEGTFVWMSTLPVGIYHGNLLIELPNDVYLLNQNGIISLGTLNIARQFATSSTENMDKLVFKYLDNINDNLDYRACRTFKYKSGGFCGFKIGLNDIIVAKYRTSLYWWGVFSGDFTKANAFLGSLDESLYLFIDNTIYRYADGTIGAPVYGDNGGTDYINFIETKYVNNIKNRFANKRYDLQCDYSSNIVINPQNIVYITIRGDLRDSFIHTEIYDLPFRGDVLGTIPLVNGNGLDPNNPSNKALGLRLNSPSHPQKGRLKFVSSKFSVSLVGRVRDGMFSLKRMRLFGLRER